MTTDTDLSHLCLAGHVVSSGATWRCNLPEGHDGPHDDGCRAHDSTWTDEPPSGEVQPVHRAVALPEVEITDHLIVVFEDAYDLPGITGGNTRAGLRAAFEAAGIRVKD